MQGTIYALCEPDTGAIRYVGKTILGMRFRTTKHRCDATKFRGKRHSANWLCGLYDSGAEPSVVILEEIDLSALLLSPLHVDLRRGKLSRHLLPTEKAQINAAVSAREMFHIRELRLAGCDLTNATDGGDGAIGRKASAEATERTRRAHLGTKRSEAARARIKAAALIRDRSTQPRGEKSAWARLTDEQVRVIFVSAALHEELAAEHGISVGYVRLLQRRLKRADVTADLAPPVFIKRRPKPRIPEQTVLDILAAEGTQKQIAARFGVSQGYVFFVKSGVMRREVSRSASNGRLHDSNAHVVQRGIAPGGP